MSFINRKPRQIGRLRTDYSPPPEEQAVDAMIERMKLPLENGDDISFEVNIPQLNIMDELKMNCRRLTWAQMMEFCTATGADPTKVHEWSSKHGQ